MTFLESYGTKRRLGQLAHAWERLRPFIEAEPSGAELEVSEEAFLALKKEIGQALAVLHEDFGSSHLNREAELAAAKIRTLLGNLPSVGALKTALSRDPDGVQRSWHAVFLSLAELQGARPPKAEKLRRGGLLSAGAGAVPMSGEPRSFRRRWHLGLGIRRFAGFLTKLVAFVAVLSIALFFAERAGVFGKVDPATGQRATASGPAGSVGKVWQAAQDWASKQFPALYNTMAEYYTRDPGTGVIILVMLAGLFVGYLLFIRVT